MNNDKALLLGLDADGDTYFENGEMKLFTGYDIPIKKSIKMPFTPNNRINFQTNNPINVKEKEPSLLDIFFSPQFKALKLILGEYEAKGVDLEEMFGEKEE